MIGTVGEIIAETLKAYGATHIFGMEDPVHLFHALDRQAIRPITIHDEKHGAVMAHAYAKVTGRPGLCAATNGPGATNLITGLLEAQKSSIPIIAFVQEISLKNRDRHASSEIDHRAALSPFVKWIGAIELPERAAETVRSAFRIATSGRPGPVAVLCPPDVMAARVEAEIYAELEYSTFPATRVRASRGRVEDAAALLLGAERPILVAGGGAIASGAWREILDLAEKYEIPVATTMNGRGVIPDSHPLGVGVLGTSTGGRYGRGKVANQMLAEADLVLILGSRTGQICYSNWTLPSPAAKIIHVDIDPMEIGRNFRTAIGLVGDVQENLVDLIEACRRRNETTANRNAASRIATLNREWHAEVAEVFASKQVPIRPERLLREISDRIDDETIVVTDASYVTGWAMSHIDSLGKGVGLISPRGTGGLGWGLPAAIGAKLARPGKTVICLTGDGGLGYVLGELETAARYKANIVLVVFNNATLAFQKHYEEKLFGRYVECDLLDVDYSAVGRDMRCLGERVTRPEEIGAALDRALAAGGPYVLDVVIDPAAMAPIVGLEPDATPEGH